MINSKTLKIKRWTKGSYQLFYKIIWWFFCWYRFVFQENYRSRVLSSIFNNGKHHQFSNFTKLNRYPELFEMAKKHFENHKNPEILSFGCSTGEEVASLQSYIPNGTFVGVDINPWCIKQAKKLFPSENNSFINSLSPEFEKESEFDAIFCLAVFQNPKNRHEKDRQTSAYSFDKFEKQLLELDQKLKKGGLLFVDHADYNFLETKTSLNYQIASFDGNMKFRNRPLFNKKEIKISQTQKLFRVFMKNEI